MLRYIIIISFSYTLIETCISQNAFPRLISKLECKNNINLRLYLNFAGRDLQNAMLPLQGDERTLLCSRIKNSICNANFVIKKTTSKSELLYNIFQFKGLFCQLWWHAYTELQNYFKNTLPLVWSIWGKGRGSHTAPHPKTWAFIQKSSTPSPSKWTLFVYLFIGYMFHSKFWNKLIS